MNEKEYDRLMQDLEAGERIAGNLAEMFRGIVAVGSDVINRGGRRTGSILIDRMTVAGH